MTLKSGYEAQYSGDIDENAQPHGYGERVIVTKGDHEGEVLTGMFAHGLFHGTGRSVFKTGKTSTGQWANGLLNGVATYEYPSGSCHTGQFKDGKKHGFGTFTYKDGRKFIGYCYDDKFDGVGLLVNTDGSKAAVEYEQDKLVFETKGLNVSSQLCSLLFYRL
jgi:hypothetical protein